MKKNNKKLRYISILNNYMYIFLKDNMQVNDFLSIFPFYNNICEIVTD